MNVSNQDADEKASVPPQGPGSLLKQARERQGFGPAEVAAQLNLQAAIIEALEANDYEQLPGPVFIQGYLRNYARLLGLQDDAIVSAYQRLLPKSEDQALLSSQEEKHNKPLHSGHGIMRLMTWGIIMVMAAMLFSWWQNQADLEEPVPLQTEQSLQTEFPPGSSLTGESAGAFEEPVKEPEIAPVIPELEPLEEIIPDLIPDVTATVEQVEGYEESPQPEFPPLEEVGESLEDVAPSQDEVPESVPAQALVEAETPVRTKTLLFEFSGPCWTEVRDREGKVRIIGEMRPGVQRRLSSQSGPFMVVFGDASVVSLTINGQPFDIKPFTRGKVARFTLDPEQM
jgi:cytoskeleton protein RodZ